MQRADDARILLAPLLPHTAGDHAAELRTLLGTAYARSGDVERGLTLLEEADVWATSVELRSEIALGIALAHYAKRDFARAEDSLAAVDASSLLVHARALECRGWIAKCRGAFPAAVSFFEAALEELDRSPQRDRFLEANLVMVLGNLAVELLDSARWGDVARRAASIAWDGLGMSYYRFWHCSAMPTSPRRSAKSSKRSTCRRCAPSRRSTSPPSLSRRSRRSVTPTVPVRHSRDWVLRASRCPSLAG